MANDFFDELGMTISKKAKDLGGKAETLYETQKIRNKMNSEEKAADKIKFDLGNLIYQRYADGSAVDGEVGALCEEISQHLQRAAAYREEAASLKGQKICPSCQKAVDKVASFCPYCGATCPSTEPEHKDVQDVVDVPEETVSEEAACEEETAEAAGEESVSEEKPEQASDETKESVPEEEPVVEAAPEE